MWGWLCTQGLRHLFVYSFSVTSFRCGLGIMTHPEGTARNNEEDRGRSLRSNPGGFYCVFLGLNFHFHSSWLWLANPYAESPSVLLDLDMWLSQSLCIAGLKFTSEYKTLRKWARNSPHWISLSPSLWLGIDTKKRKYLTEKVTGTTLFQGTL